MTLHIFNPEHDIALASYKQFFTPPHAARKLRDDLGFLPAIWGQDGDAVLVDNKADSQCEFMKLKSSMASIGIKHERHIQFIEPSEIKDNDIKDISPWGWDNSLAYRCRQQGIEEDCLPTSDELDNIRLLSHRKTSIPLLKELRNIENTIGESYLCYTLDEIIQMQENLENIVIKAPWSSSGRGLRFGIGCLTDHQKGWIKNMLVKQGVLIVEPYYKKVMDFGMEFFKQPDGSFRYYGLSLFDTHNGSYIGNLLATEEKKREIMSRVCDIALIDRIKDLTCNVLPNIINDYTGPIGIDMMVLHNGIIHPCVEINLRRTMGHVAISMSPTDDDIQRAMRIEIINNNYKLKIRHL